MTEIIKCSVCGKCVAPKPILGGMWHTDGTMMCVDGTVQWTAYIECGVEFAKLTDVTCTRPIGHVGQHSAPGVRWDDGWGEDPVPEPHWSDILTPDQKRKFTNDWGFRPEDAELRQLADKRRMESPQESQNSLEKNA